MIFNNVQMCFLNDQLHVNYSKSFSVYHVYGNVHKFDTDAAIRSRVCVVLPWLLCRLGNLIPGPFVPRYYALYFHYTC